ncbi:holo-ACP synthase [Treponema sp.]|uniref:holo-ACP synthase n=1 Tax=Treponema sp. TaxID=166 RepID=UPI0025EA43B5|nr:holo-ACP synthase [Treponema sp.]MCR5218114.1 holo-ACP synthase [Treponema sp.]
MIFGIGTDIVETCRLEKWIKNSLIQRFYNPKEIAFLKENSSIQRQCEYFASRFAAKEAFSKALGTGLCGFDLKDVYTVIDEAGKPALSLEGRALQKVKEQCGKDYVIHLSLTHEKEYALAFVVIEKLD